MVRKEQLPNGQHGVDLNIFQLDLAGSEAKQLRELIQSQQQQLPFFVHPFFEFYALHPKIVPALGAWGRDFPLHRQGFIERFATDDLYATAQYERLLAEYGIKWIRFLQHTSFPVIAVAEEKFRRKTTLQVIRDQGYQGTVLFYETKDALPVPADKRGFMPLIEFCHSAQLKHLVVGGQYGIRRKTGGEIGDNRLLEKGIFAYDVDRRKNSYATIRYYHIGGGKKECVAGFIMGIYEAANQKAYPGEDLHRTQVAEVLPQTITLSPIIYKESF